MAALRRHDPLPEVLPRRHVRVPETIPAVPEVRAGLPVRGTGPVRLQRLEERHLDVDVVLVNAVGDELRLPLPQRPGDWLPIRLELVDRAVAHADHLPGPTPTQAIAEGLDRQGPCLGGTRWRDACSNYGHPCRSKTESEEATEAHGSLPEVR